MAETLCSVCPQVGTFKCSRCHDTHYCKRECQKADWSAHKKICGELLKKNQELILKYTREKFIAYAHARISGNIFILASHKQGTAGVVTALLTETIEEFTNVKESLHCAYLNFDSTYDSKPGHVTTHYILSNYQTTIHTPIQDPEWFANLKNKNPEPEDDWPIFFEI